jgi:hypothetical protein
MITLEQIEARIQELIEVRLPSILPGHKMEQVVLQQFAGAMRSNLTERDGKKFAPNIYTLIVRPNEFEAWQDARLIDALKESIHTAGREAGLDFASPPALSVSSDPSVPAGQVHVVASHKVESLGPTSNVIQEEPAKSEENHVPENAFLIIDGRKVFPLKTAVINIGRRLENQLVIDDPRVSRTHSQLRAIKGRYVVFDLNSTGGTFVNGQRSNQTVLYPGDVISLAGVTLVFGQDNPPPRPDLKETGPLNTQNADRPTAILKDRTDLRKKKK